jgi:hypothetical protein
MPGALSKGHQGTNPGGHHFVFLNVSINKKPFFFSEVVTFKVAQFGGNRGSFDLNSYLL